MVGCRCFAIRALPRGRLAAPNATRRLHHDVLGRNAAYTAARHAIVPRQNPLPVLRSHPVPRPEDARPRGPGAAADSALLRPARPAHRAAERGAVEERDPRRGLERRGGQRRCSEPGGPDPPAHVGRQSARADLHPYGAAARLPLRLRRCRRGTGRGTVGARTGRHGGARPERLLRPGPRGVGRRRFRRRRRSGRPSATGGRDPAPTGDGGSSRPAEPQ